MPRKPPINIYGQVFSTKRELQDAMRRLVARYRSGDLLDPGDLAFVTELVWRHPRAAQKIGTGVAAIQVQKTHHGSRGLILIRTDDTKTDFSWIKCIYDQNPLSDVYRACRAAVFRQIGAFKDRCFQEELVPRCPILNIPLTRENAHADHEPPLTFEALVHDFCDLQKLDLKDIRILGYEDGERERRFADQHLTLAWQAYHQKNARLRLVSQKANLSHIKRQANELCPKSSR